MWLRQRTQSSLHSCREVTPAGMWRLLTIAHLSEYSVRETGAANGSRTEQIRWGTTVLPGKGWPKYRSSNRQRISWCAVVNRQSCGIRVCFYRKRDLGAVVSQGRKAVPEMPKILVAEDDNAVRGMLSTALERDGFDVVAVANVREALRRIAAEP